MLGGQAGAITTELDAQAPSWPSIGREGVNVELIDTHVRWLIALIIRELRELT